MLGHRSGVIGPRIRLTPSETLDWDWVCRHIATAEPWWQPGTAQGYHMVSFGFILGEIVRRVTGRTLGEYLRREIAEPLGIDVHIGLPEAEHHRCADMVDKPHIRDVLANGNAPGYPTSITEHPMAAFSVAMGFIPDDELGSTDIASVAHRRIPVHQRPRHRARSGDLLQRARPRQVAHLRAHGEMPNLAGRLRH